jgi:glycosyltransferase involved in cell wall biosynthesis
MRVWFQYDKLKGSAGKSKFLSRLIPALADLGCKVKFREKGCDVAFSLIRFRKKTKLPKVLRLDGVYVDGTKKGRWTNKIIGKSIKKADAVIWQSGFCKKMGHKYVGKGKREYTIMNGANPADYANVEPFKSDYEYNCILVAKWRRYKGLKDMLKIIYNMRVDICFWVIGKVPHHVEPRANIRFIGKLGETRLRTFYKMADCMLHMPKVDWCPNAVVESMCAGTPVIVNNVLSDMVQGGGVVCKPEEVPEAIYSYCKGKPKIYNPNVDIKNVAEKYLGVFKRVAR